jgi:hypothetical protein
MALPVTVESVSSVARDAAIASLHQLLGDRLSTAAPVREQHGKDASYHPCVPPDRRRIRAIDCGGGRHCQDMCAVQSADDPFWQRHRLGRPCRGVAGRSVYRYLADEPDPAGQRWRRCSKPMRSQNAVLMEFLKCINAASISFLKSTRAA